MKLIATLAALAAALLLAACEPGPRIIRVSPSDGADLAMEEVKPPPGLPRGVGAPARDPDPEALMCMARTLYFEARSQGDREVRAVAHVVLNRVAHPDFPDTVCGVVHEGGRQRPCQFGWYCDGRSDEMTNPHQAARMVGIAREALAGESRDPTDGANMFHAVRLLPFWTRSAEGGMRIGAHRFWRLESR